MNILERCAECGRPIERRYGLLLHRAPPPQGEIGTAQSVRWGTELGLWILATAGHPATILEEA